VVVGTKNKAIIGMRQKIDFPSESQIRLSNLVFG
jgi:hypothetical protein